MAGVAQTSAPTGRDVPKPPQVKPGFQAQITDSLGRKQCYDRVRGHIPCNPGQTSTQPEKTPPQAATGQETSQAESTEPEIEFDLDPDGENAAKEQRKQQLIRTPQFKQWFGDWENDPVNASKVVDDRGQPKENFGPEIKTVYHGTRVEFDQFDSTKVSSGGLVGKGFYFAENIGIANDYASGGGKVIEAFINMRRPYNFNEMSTLDAFCSKLESIDPNFKRESITKHVKKDREREGPVTLGKLWRFASAEYGSAKVNQKIQAMGYDGIVHYAEDYAGAPFFDKVTYEEDAPAGKVWIAFEPTQIKSIENEGAFDAKNPNMYKGLPTPPKVGPGQLFTGRIQDSAGRGQCYNQGQHVPCGSVETPNQPEPEQTQSPTPTDAKEELLTQSPTKTEEVTQGGEQSQKLRTPEFKSWFGDWENDPQNCSKVVDKKGNPEENYEVTRVYHGTKTKFEKFDEDKIGKHGLFSGKGFYFTENRKTAEGYTEDTGEIIEAYLNVRKPFDFATMFNNRDRERIREAARNTLGEEFNEVQYSREFQRRLQETYPGPQPDIFSKSMSGHAIYESLKEAAGEANVNDVLMELGYDGLTAIASDEAGHPIENDPENFGRLWVVFKPTQIKSTKNQGAFNPKDANIYKGLFYKTLGPHDYGCLMAILPEAIGKKITDWCLENIPDFHLAEEGREPRPHITVKYGFKNSSPETVAQLKSFLANVQLGPIALEIKELALFEGNDSGSVLHATVTSPDLERINAAITEVFPCEDKYPNYHPHMTLAYINPLNARTYVSEEYQESFRRAIESYGIGVKSLQPQMPQVRDTPLVNGPITFKDGSVHCYNQGVQTECPKEETEQDKREGDNKESTENNPEKINNQPNISDTYEEVDNTKLNNLSTENIRKIVEDQGGLAAVSALGGDQKIAEKLILDWSAHSHQLEAWEFRALADPTGFEKYAEIFFARKGNAPLVDNRELTFEDVKEATRSALADPKKVRAFAAIKKVSQANYIPFASQSFVDENGGWNLFRGIEGKAVNELYLKLWGPKGNLRRFAEIDLNHLQSFTHDPKIAKMYADPDVGGSKPGAIFDAKIPREAVIYDGEAFKDIWKDRGQDQLARKEVIVKLMKVEINPYSFKYRAPNNTNFKDPIAKKEPTRRSRKFLNYSVKSSPFEK